MPKKYYSKSDALKKLQRYCAYQDRCHQEVRSKLLDISIYGDDLEEVMYDLITENFLNEERFAKSFARGKFRLKKWGRNKIINSLKQKKITSYCIKEGLKEIEEIEYQNTLENLLNKKWELIREANRFKKGKKAAMYLMQKGYESHLIWKFIKQKQDE